METLDSFFNNTTSQFYVVLTGTSSFLSGVLMFLEWLHFTYFGISIVDRISSFIIRIIPFILNRQKKDSKNMKAPNAKKVPDAKPVRNSLMLFRGAEYNRYFLETNRNPLVEYDVTLTSLELRSFFTFDGVTLESGTSEQQLINGVWREPNRTKRIKIAHEALLINPSCPLALIVLAEEEANSILEVEEQLKIALKSAEGASKTSHIMSQQDPMYKPLHERNQYVCSYCRIRLAVCARKLGKLKEASKMYRDLLRDDRALAMVNINENLIECLLEMQCYNDVQQLLQKQEDVVLYKSTVFCYTLALIKARALTEKFSPDTVARRGPNTAEMIAVDAIHCAVEMNPHIPKYLLELKSLILPPEHYFKRGDSEAVVYVFNHLQHWKQVSGALQLFSSTWEGAFRRIPFPLERGHHFPAYPPSMEAIDRQVLPPYHKLSVFPHRETPFFMVFTGVLCFSFMTLTVVAYHFPKAMTQYAKAVTTLFLVVLEKVIPTDFFGIF